jgi:lipopolysaccharide/colanic/teichoic acid biosynthesis glycosyltransferase
LRALVLGVRPGITDPASLKYADEATLLAAAADPEREYREVLLPAKLRESADYIRGATLASDLWVLARTAALLLGRRGG